MWCIAFQAEKLLMSLVLRNCLIMGIGPPNSPFPLSPQIEAVAYSRGVGTRIVSDLGHYLSLILNLNLVPQALMIAKLELSYEILANFMCESDK
ncbi:hypothetical protein LIER_20820 [Lithospermum erythrorhizon]|uniref:Uncharacterized protein n=1 Tax=Lithospermum erythrorhizon TaxID=34254 RepID=A0AAV3QP01_LITER